LLHPQRLSLSLGYTLWLLLLWFSETLTKEFGLPNEIFPMGINLALGIMVVHFASLFIKSAFWSRFAFVVCLVAISLRVFKVWAPAVRLLNSMEVNLGSISFTVWGLLRASFISVILWFAALTTSRFFGNWLARSKHLTSSDRILVERVFNTALICVVVLISLSAAGIHFAAVAITGGAFGIAIGMGLQKIGSNVVSGLNLLISKPVRPGDVIALTGTISGIDYGEITQMNLTYVRVATRDGTEQLIPNELFLVNKVENLSYSNNLYRLRIPVGISYAANVEKASSIAVTAAMNVGRVLRSPGPQCLIKGYGDS
jgi:small-conductance mechanosensitive channel